MLCGVADLYIVDFGGGEQERARRDSERDAERRRLADRYARYLAARAEMDQASALKVITALFDPRDGDGNECPCSCHPRLSAEHGDGFDCRCTWDADRRAAEAADWQAWWDSPEAAELSGVHQREEDVIAAWLASQPGVDARRTSSYAPEQWEGTVGSHTFYFRERGGLWRIELDMVPSGRYAQRLVRVGEDGTFVTEPVPITADPLAILRDLPEREREEFLRQYRLVVEAAHDPARYQRLRHLLHLWSLTTIAVGQPGYYEELTAVRAGTATTVPVTDAIPDWDQRVVVATHRR
jgi:Family of unknown function (DUF6247)